MIATPDQYAQMLDRAEAVGIRPPGVNVTSTQALDAGWLLHEITTRLPGR